MRNIRGQLRAQAHGGRTIAKQCKCGQWFTTRQRIQALCPKCAAKEGQASHG
jgi:hypothetical protein